MAPGSVDLLAAFPLAFTTLISAVYFPILLTLLGLIFRGVAFDSIRVTRTGGLCGTTISVMDR